MVRNQTKVTVVGEINWSPHVTRPASQRFHSQANRRRRQDAVGPDYLWTWPGCSIGLRLLGQLFRSNKAEALHASMTWNRQDNLSCHSWGFTIHLMDVHPNINVQN